MKFCLRCNSAFVGVQWGCPCCTHVPQEQDGFISFAPELSELTDSYDAERYAAIAAVEGAHFWFQARNELIKWALEQYFPSARSLLEVGCGTGQVLESVHAVRPNLRLVGTEIHTRGLGFTQRRLPGIELLQMDAREIPFTEEFDVVCAFDVIEHIDEDIKVLEQMYKACRPEGGILITVPQHRWLWSHKDDFAHHKRRYSRVELEQKVARAGFRVLAATSFVTLLLPFMYISRLWQRTPAKFDSGRELAINPTLNQAFLTLMRCERALIRNGASLPAGGSLLLSAKKI